MPRNEPGSGRHQLRVWLKLAIESGVLDRVTPVYDPDGSGEPQPIHDYARALLAELKVPESSGRMLRDIIADARRFRHWIEYRQKVSRRMILGQWDTTGAADLGPQLRPPARPDRDKHPRPVRPGSGRRETSHEPEADANPRLHPLWDDWLDR